MAKSKQKKTKSIRKKTDSRPAVRFPATILRPITDFLSGEAKRLEKRKAVLIQEDPFSDPSRVIDNASPDTEAIEQVGHARVESLRQHTERRLIQIRKALTRIKIGKYATCEKCGKMIDTDRLMIMPEATVCIKCEKNKEK